MTEDGLSQQKVKLPIKCSKRKILVINEARLFQTHHILPDFLSDALLDQPLVGLNRKILPRLQIGNKKPSTPQGAGANVYEGMVVAQSETGE